MSIGDISIDYDFYLKNKDAIPRNPEKIKHLKAEGFRFPNSKNLKNLKLHTQKLSRENHFMFDGKKSKKEKLKEKLQSSSTKKLLKKILNS